LTPFASYINASKTTYALSSELVYGRESEEWLAPLNLVVSQHSIVGKPSLQGGVEGAIIPKSPRADRSGGSTSIVLVFPKEGGGTTFNRRGL
jgi:hypothetical protein